MKVQRNLFKWMGMAFLFAIFISFTFLLPPAFAQEGEATPTPSETPAKNCKSRFDKSPPPCYT
ncbi:MAG: hypothetical protein UZ14_CFX002003206 [Chloroflexi bacterium OLB14]|nr:MAG: hypothetical protein UZ14_CFX002003206 [Chloroflexi bacterium OLB14]